MTVLYPHRADMWPRGRGEERGQVVRRVARRARMRATSLVGFLLASFPVSIWSSLADEQLRERNKRLCAGEVTADHVGLLRNRLRPATKVYSCNADGHGDILYLENFIGEAEVRALREQERRYHERYYVSKTSMFRNNTVRVHRFTQGLTPVLNEVHGRILGMLGNGTGQRRLFNPMMQFTRYGAPTGLNQFHHDRNFDIDRFVTILVYLEASSAPGAGGHTVFPFVAPHGQRLEGASAAMRNRVMPPAGSESNAKLIYRRGIEYDHVQSLCADAAAADAAGKHYTSFSPAPVVGDAVLFWQWGGKGGATFRPAWDHMHGACGLNSGSKLSMQAFVQLPGITKLFHQRSGGTGSCRFSGKTYGLSCGPAPGAATQQLGWKDFTALRAQRKPRHRIVHPDLTAQEQTVMPNNLQAGNAHGWSRHSDSKGALKAAKPHPIEIGPPSVAVCMLGLLRSLASRFVQTNLAERLLAPLASTAKVHLFVHINATDVPRRYRNLARSNLTAPEDALILKDAVAALGALASRVTLATSADLPLYPNRCAISKLERGLKGHMALRMRMMDVYTNMLLPAERALGQPFQWVVYTRPDVIFLRPLPSLASLATLGKGAAGTRQSRMFISNWHKSFDATGKVAMQHGFSDHFFIATRDAAHAAFIAPLEHICAGSRPQPVLGHKLHPESSTWAAITGANVTVFHHEDIVPVVTRYWAGLECFRLASFQRQLRSCCKHARDYEGQSQPSPSDVALGEERRHANGLCKRVRSRWGDTDPLATTPVAST